MNLRRSLSALALSSLMLLTQACHKSDLNCTGVSADCTQVTFSGTISPLASSKCSSCHDASFLSYGNMHSLAVNGTLENQVVTTQNMPSGGITMTCEERSQLECWINAGAPQN